MIRSGWLSQLACGLLLWSLLVAACAPAAAPTSSPPKPAAAGPAAAAPTAAPAGATAPAAPPVSARVRFAMQPSAGAAAVFVAAERGYFRQEGLEVELVPFSYSSEMMPSLATDQVETAIVGGNPAMWNAVARGVPIKIVLDMIALRPGHGSIALVIRKDLYDAGRGRTLGDLAGLKLAMVPPGKATVSACSVAHGLERIGRTLDDLTIEPLPGPDSVPALANGSIDGAVLSEPFVAQVQRQGTAVRVMGLDEMYPDFSLAQVGYSPAFYANRPAGKAFARAYVRAAREYLAATGGLTSEADRAQIDEIIARQTNIPAATVREMVPSGMNPNGLPNRESLLYCYRLFRDLGAIPEPVSDAALAALWGTELVEEVLGEIGRVADR